MIFAFNITAQTTGTFTDKRDGKTYNTITCRYDTWMAENLDYKTKESWCYKEDSKNCSKYGRLYSYKSAKNVCPSGWHLPSKEEFKRLIDRFGIGSDQRYEALKTGGDSGFNAKLGGRRNKDGTYTQLDSFGGLYSSSKFGRGAHFLMLVKNKKRALMSLNIEPTIGYSVRCVKD